MTADRLPRLPRNLRRRAATERVVGWSWPPAPVLDEHDDEPKPRRCKCSHGPSTHTGGAGRCWQTPCCCESYRDPKETA